MEEFSSHDAMSLAQLVRDGQVSARELVTASIERIESLNPQLNAVVHRMYDGALRQADAPRGDGPFDGVPFMLKDLLSWYAGEPITSGSRLFRGWIPPHDTEMVRRYRKAGVIVVGKTNTPELGLTPYTEPELFGPARNPWDPMLSTGGSSGGSAAAVASGMVPWAGGGDGGGSIRIPASCCGIFGLKPTRGRTPVGPVAGEVWQGAVVEHCLTRSVRDSAAMLDAVAGPETGAPYHTAPPLRPFLEEVTTAPGRLRAAFTSAPMLGHTVHADCKAALGDAVRLMESLGHDVIEAEPPIDREDFNRAFLTVVCGEVRADLLQARTLIGRAATRQDVEYTTWALSLLGASLSAGAFVRAERYLRTAARRIGEFFETVDVLITPTMSVPPFPIGSLQPPAHERAVLRMLGRLRAGGILKLMRALEQSADKIFDAIPYTPQFNVTGQPAMSVPLYWNAANLPIGIHVVGKYGDEATLFRLAGQLETARPWKDRRPPISR
ncbi:MAG: amidase [Gemmatimonadaceae bacterium]|nr:amidase [Gemmatimonadaceae bacterium]MDQ3242176.1 amidase [Gemmatimonadota bacterium]